MSDGKGKALQQRNFGIDLLKTMAMLCIVLLHVLLHGGMLWNMATFSDKYAIIWLMYTVTCCAVNCYALISGYVGVASRASPGRLIGYWLQVVFYSAGIFLVFRFVFPQRIPAVDWLTYVTPVSSGVYWYFTAYFCIALFAPLLNAGLRSVQEHVLRQALLIGFFLFSVIPLWSQKDPYFLNEGLSAFWLGYLYLVGGYIRLHGHRTAGCRWKWYLAVCVFAACILTAWGWKIFSERGWFSLPAGTRAGLLINNTSPAIVLASVALLVLFAGIRIRESVGRYCARLSTLTFGVYLIHDHPLVREYLMKDRFTWMIDAFDYRTLPVVVLVSAAGIFAVCAAAEALRIRLFAALKIRQGYLSLIKAVRKTEE